MLEIELPGDIQQLLRSCDDYCNEVERRALETVSSVEVPVFNVLRDITARNCYLVLCHISKWFGSVPTMEHCTCLMVLTEYISCSYNNTDFYDTFVKEKQDKFYDTFFVKLAIEWKKVFLKLSCREITLDQYISLKKSLKTSFHRFSSTFAYKWVLEKILTACYEYGDKLRDFLSNPSAPVPAISKLFPKKPVLHTKIDKMVGTINNPAQFNAAILNAINKPIAKKSTVVSSHTIIPKSCVLNPAPRTNFLQPLKNSSQTIRVVTNDEIPATVLPKIVKPMIPSISSQAVQIPKLVDLQAQSVVIQPEVIVIDDTPSPNKIRCKSFAKEGNCPSFLLSKTEAKQFECERKNFLPFNSIENSCGADQKNNTPSKPKILNAFDVLMRRSVKKKRTA